MPGVGVALLLERKFRKNRFNFAVQRSRSAVAGSGAVGVELDDTPIGVRPSHHFDSHLGANNLFYERRGRKFRHVSSSEIKSC